MRLLVVLQHDILSDLQSFVVAPLYPVLGAGAVSRLRPIVRVGETDYMIAVDRLLTLERRELGPPVANAREHADAIKNALDLVFSGF